MSGTQLGYNSVSSTDVCVYYIYAGSTYTNSKVNLEAQYVDSSGFES